MPSAIAQIEKAIESCPLPKFLQSLCTSLADAQLALDRRAAELLREMADPAHGIKLPAAGHSEPRAFSLLELGFEPCFLHIQEATISAKYSLSVSESQEVGAGATIGGGYPGIVSASVSASYAQKYSFDSALATEITTKLVSVPAPSQLLSRIRAMQSK